ncbi:MAG: asparagine synthase (glutamine-hydrolyzing) [Phycisphaerae bacterium]|nr:asparagine synthase (glutamine-hydrolyzing) [Phycisphaerae bacterium]
MCGIVGYWCASTAPQSLIVRHMADQIQSRGPDDCGTWIDIDAGVAFGHRRLSIIDLSPAGHQPMVSPCGRFVLTFNGEIYNHLDLRTELEAVGGGFDWRGHSDSETLLAALRHWGVEGALKKLNGMFAFGLWDCVEQVLHLARDRMGEKPLYYGRTGNTFLFGSELKAMRAHPQWHGEIDRAALTLYLRHSYVPAPWTIYKGIQKLCPAQYVVISNSGQTIATPKRYWDIEQVAAATNRLTGCDERELVDSLDDLLRDAVRMRMAADVPLGAFLSGGYDSSMVVALMQAQSTQKVRTFSIGFEEDTHNEAPHAKAVAEHLGTDHTELYVTAQQAMDVIPQLPRIYDEPFADSSQIPTFLVSQMAREHVTVSLSGDGGDELFCGYNRYAMGFRAWKMLSRFPRPARQTIAWGCRRAPSKLLAGLQPCLPKRLRIMNLADRLPKLAEVLAYRNGAAFYRSLVSHAKHPAALIIGGHEPDTPLSDLSHVPEGLDLREQMMYLDMLTYLPDDILTKVDRASMAVSLEARVPLLDHRLVEFAWQVPLEFKYREGRGKWLFREVLYRYVPKGLLDRPKMGFGVPIEHWLRGPLRAWAEDLLSTSRLEREGFFEPGPIRLMWDDHLSGKRRTHHYLWDVLMFQAWLDGHENA